MSASEALPATDVMCGVEGTEVGPRGTKREGLLEGAHVEAPEAAETH